MDYSDYFKEFEKYSDKFKKLEGEENNFYEQMEEINQIVVKHYDFCNEIEEKINLECERIKMKMEQAASKLNYTLNFFRYFIDLNTKRDPIDERFIDISSFSDN